MLDFLICKYVHIICLVYWLGGDLGTFLASRYLVNASLGAEARLIATKILIACDQGPRFAMPVILPTGCQMAYSMGVFQVSPVVMGMIWCLSFIWLATIITLHFMHGKSPAWLTKADWVIRIAVCLVTLGYGFVSLVADTQLLGHWAGFKMGIYGITVLMGLCIRIKLKPFFRVFPNIIKNTIDTNTNHIIHDSVAGARPFVFVIWIALFLNTAFGLHLL